MFGDNGPSVQRQRHDAFLPHTAYILARALKPHVSAALVPDGNMELNGAMVEEGFAALDPDNVGQMMWHIGKAVITAAVILMMMLGLAVFKRPKSVRLGGKAGSGVSLHVWVTLLLPNAVMHACGGACCLTVCG